MRRVAPLALVPVVAALVALTGPAAFASSSDDLDFEAPLVGSTPAPDGPVLFGVAPGGVPWVTEDSRARIDDGELRVRIRGLVIPATGGTNGIPTVRATVFCDGKAAATSASVPFSSTGDAEIRQVVTLPSPCVSPAVLVQPAALPRYIAFTQ